MFEFMKVLSPKQYNLNILKIISFVTPLQLEMKSYQLCGIESIFYFTIKKIINTNK